MLISGSELLDTQVMSLQTGKELARTHAAIINPHNLSIIAYLLVGEHLDSDPSYLRVADIREVGGLGIIVDSSDEFIETDDIITDEAIYELDFTLLDKHVLDDRRKKLGKVSDYTVDVDSFVIQQLTVKRPFLKSFTDDELLINRRQIVEVTDSAIVIKSGKIKAEKITQGMSRHYANPFRQTNPQPEVANSDSND